MRQEQLAGAVCDVGAKPLKIKRFWECVFYFILESRLVTNGRNEL
jgi:hypothetical protein